MTETQSNHAHTDAYRRGDRSPAAVEHEIDAERRNVSDTIEALQGKMSVGSLADEAWTRYGHYGTDAARALGRSAAQNPLPLMLTGIGLAWLMVSSRSRQGNGHDYDRGLYDEDFVAVSDGGTAARPYGTAVVAGPYEPSDRPSKRARARGAVGSAWDSARGAAGSAAHLAGDAGHSAYDGARDAAGSASRYAGKAANRARGAAGAMGDAAHRAGVMMDDYPLAMGALALALGAALGGALPRTRTEDEYFGEYSDEAWHMAEEEGRKARRVAGAVADEARHIAEEKYDEVRHEAGDAAERLRHRAEEEGRDVAGRAKSEAKEAANRLSETAKDEARKQDLGHPGKHS